MMKTNTNTKEMLTLYSISGDNSMNMTKIPSDDAGNVVYAIYHNQTKKVVYVGSTTMPIMKRFPYNTWWLDLIHSVNPHEWSIDPNDYTLIPIATLGEGNQGKRLRELEACYVKFFGTYGKGWNLTPEGESLETWAFYEISSLSDRVRKLEEELSTKN